MATTLFPATVNLMPDLGQGVVIAIVVLIVAITLVGLTAKAWVR